MSDDVFGAGDGRGAEQVPVDKLGYEEARDELVETVKLLEMGQMGLDDSLALWERGEALAKRCEEHLAGAKAKVEAALSHGTADAAGDGEDADD
ncbi:exodeoxyribonuclease VII small subunit [uncultured Corynebacterium sp.]|uniref:exodeoxyribonuclease VII small subunit n=1 Tax=uncultured Corynebacterium sp. TaxID=159447 RepID=UPI0025FCD56C|nr:exodeoxyribonuclease VII small subunit [uncultured Corynebacterium sp.]